MAILFIPFTTRENNRNLIGMAAAWQAAHALQDASFGQVENRIFQENVPVLEDIQRDETVYILAHGQGTDYVVNDVVPMTVKDIFGQNQLINSVLDAAEIARRVEAAGLPKRHRVIKLSICNTNGTMDRFAVAFKTEMIFRGYAAIEIYYYAGSVSIARPVQGAPGQVAQHIVVSGPNGALVPTPSGLVQANRALVAEPLFMYRA